MTPRIYVASLSDYNAGRLHGVWIDADSDVDVMAEQVAAMLAESRHQPAEDYAIHDHEGFPVRIGEFTSLREIAEIMEAIEAIEDRVHDGETALAVMGALDGAGYAPSAWGDLLDEGVDVYGPFDGLYPERDLAFGHEEQGFSLPTDIDYFDYRRYGHDLQVRNEVDVDDLPPDVVSDEDVGLYVIEERYGHGSIPRDLYEQHFDYAAWGRDLAQDFVEVKGRGMNRYYVRVP